VACHAARLIQRSIIFHPDPAVVHKTKSQFCPLSYNRNRGLVEVGFSLSKGSTNRVSMPRTKSLPAPLHRKVRVLLADGETLVVEGLRALLETEFDVVGAVTDGRSLIDKCRLLKPEVVVLDVAIPALNGLDAGRQLVLACPSVKIVLLTNKTEARSAKVPGPRGVGYVSKSAAAAELKNAIRAAVSGRPQKSVVQSNGDTLEGSSEHLTSRQREVLELIVEGRSMKEVAEILHVTPRTVAFHKYNMMDRLRLKSTAELVQFAVKQGFLGQLPANSGPKSGIARSSR